MFFSIFACFLFHFFIYLHINSNCNKKKTLHNTILALICRKKYFQLSGGHAQMLTAATYRLTAFWYCVLSGAAKYKTKPTEK